MKRHTDPVYKEAMPLSAMCQHVHTPCNIISTVFPKVQFHRIGGWLPSHVFIRKSLPSNYRPVSLTSVVCKVLESIIRDHIVKHLSKYNMILKSQHGFLKGRSCLTNLLTFLEDVTEFPVDVIYLDFAKAFDNVPHYRLIRKLAAHGIRG